MKKNSVLTLLVLAAVFIAGFITSAALFTASAGMRPMLTGAMITRLPCMNTEGCVETDVAVDSATIYLTSGCYRLGIVTNELQTYSINSGMQGIRGIRPTTHDIMEDMMDMFDMEPLIVKIESISQGTYFAKLAVNQGNKVLEMDIRPSDAIAIAVRTGAPVYVNQSLLEQYGEFMC